MGVTIMVLLLIAVSGCPQPDTTVVRVPVNITPGTTSHSLQVPCGTTVIPAAAAITIAPFLPTGQVFPAALLPEQTSEPASGLAVTTGYRHYAGTDYSLEYPATWGTNVTTLPLREYLHTRYGCSVMLAYQLDQELRMYYSGDNTTIFYSSVVDTQRDIWPRDRDGHVDYADIVNSVLGNPDYCANTPMGAFTISDVTEVPLGGVSYNGVRVDFGKINATGFTVGTGTAYVVTGMNRQGVFTFYTTSRDPGVRYTVSAYMFNSLQLDSRF
jgi:hypothetical protein